MAYLNRAPPIFVNLSSSFGIGFGNGAAICGQPVSPILELDADADLGILTFIPMILSNSSLSLRIASRS